MRLALNLLFVACLPFPARSQTGEAVMDRLTRAAGGEKVLRAVKTQYAEVETAIPGSGNMIAKLWFTADGNNRVIAELPGGGKQESGVYRGVAWSVDAGRARILTGVERDSELHDSSIFDYELWRDHHSRAELMGSETIEGEKCHGCG